MRRGAFLARIDAHAYYLTAGDIAMELQDIKLREQDTRLVLFGSTVFKLKYRASRELREAPKTESSEGKIQNDLKVNEIFLIILSFKLFLRE